MLSIASNVLFVKGYKQNLIIDLQHDAWYHVDFVLTKETLCNLDDKVLKYMILESIIFDVPKEILSNFRPLDLTYYSSKIIENSIIDFDKNSQFSVAKVIKLLSTLRCRNLQVRFFDFISLKQIKQIFECSKGTSIETIEVLVKYDKDYLNVLNLCKEYPNFLKILFYSVDTFSKVSSDNIAYFTKENIQDSSNCGIVSPQYFSGNQGHVIKSINHNSCLHNKISVDVLGNIKNCPALNTTLGYVDSVNDEDILQFISKNTVPKKDEVEVCQDCEFRYICTDCRAFTDSTSRSNARPSKCNYNPYISKWSHEEGYKTLAECGVISNEHVFSIDHEKIADINKVLWADDE